MDPKRFAIYIIMKVLVLQRRCICSDVFGCGGDAPRTIGFFEKGTTLVLFHVIIA